MTGMVRPKYPNKGYVGFVRVMGRKPVHFVGALEKENEITFLSPFTEIFDVVLIKDW